MSHGTLTTKQPRIATGARRPTFRGGGARATYARKGYIAQPLTSSRTPSTFSRTVWVTAPSLKSLRKM